MQFGGLSVAKKTIAERALAAVHDRRSTDLTRNAQVSPAVVDDPYSTIGEKIQVTRSLRDDPLAWMDSRGFLHPSQLAAGRRWQAILERAQIGGVKAIDPTKEAVDGKRIPEPITDGQIKATKQLAEADRELGLEGCALVRDILEHRMTVAVAAARRGLTKEPEVKYLGRRFRECLDTLAKLWGLATKA